MKLRPFRSTRKIPDIKTSLVEQICSAKKKMLGHVCGFVSTDFNVCMRFKVSPSTKNGQNAHNFSIQKHNPFRSVFKS